MAQQEISLVRPHGNTARKHSEETKAKMRAAWVKRKEKLANGEIEPYKHSDETRHLLSVKNTGYEHTPEARAKISHGNKGKKRSPEARRNMSEAQKRRYARKPKESPSAETREKMSKSLKGRKHTEATKANMRAAWVLRKARGDGQPTLGHKHTPETKAKMSEAQLRRYGGETASTETASTELSLDAGDCLAVIDHRYNNFTEAPNEENINRLFDALVQYTNYQ